MVGAFKRRGRKKQDPGQVKDWKGVEGCVAGGGGGGGGNNLWKSKLDVAASLVVVVVGTGKVRGGARVDETSK